MSRRPSSRGAASGSRRRAAIRHLTSRGIEVLYEDNHVLGLAKPAGLASQGGTGLDDHLVARVEAYRREAEQKSGRAYVGLVHRLDRNVSGAVVVAKTSKAAGRLSRAFRDRGRGLRKIYVAWVTGRVEDEAATLEDELAREGKVTRPAPADAEDAQTARLRYTVDGRGPEATRLRVELDTGRTHQIRAQLAARGHPIVGDAKYGGGRGRRVALHALLLQVPHPVQERPIRLLAPVPPDLLRLDEGLRIRPPQRAT